MRRKISVRKQMLVGLSVALMAIISQITIPMGVVPVTFQTFAVVVIAIVLERQLAVWSLLIYILLGAIGLPVFAGFTGGVPIVIGPTGGFILGFLVMAFIIGTASKSTKPLVLGGVVWSSIAVDYFLGVLQLAYVTQISLKEAFVLGALPFIAKDLILSVVALGIGLHIKKIIKKVGLYYA